MINKGPRSPEVQEQLLHLCCISLFSQLQFYMFSTAIPEAASLLDVILSTMTVSSADFMTMLVSWVGFAVLHVEGEEERAQHTALRCASDSGGNLPPPQSSWCAREEVQDPASEV